MQHPLFKWLSSKELNGWTIKPRRGISANMLSTKKDKLPTFFACVKLNDAALRKRLLI
jgi:hypothetical protein